MEYLSIRLLYTLSFKINIFTKNKHHTEPEFPDNIYVD